jgi:hypothetical protein
MLQNKEKEEITCDASKLTNEEEEVTWGSSNLNMLDGLSVMTVRWVVLAYS